jgi:signal transduction histidine kinase
MVFVRQIVDEHRGTISLDSKLGRGTTVTIRLPHRFTESAEVSEEKGPTGGPGPAPPGTERVQ